MALWLNTRGWNPKCLEIKDSLRLSYTFAHGKKNESAQIPFPNAVFVLILAFFFYFPLTHSPRDQVPPGKISAQPHTIIKQSRIPKVHQLVLFSSSKNCMHNEVCNWMEILPPCHPTDKF